MAGKFRVALIDDSATIVKRLTKLLAEMPDVELVGTASSGGEAVRLVMQARPDIAFMDLVMPGMDGQAAIRTLRKVSPGTRVVVLSSIAGDPTVRAQLQRLGVVDLLCKPFDADSIRAVLDKEQELKSELEELSELMLDDDDLELAL